MRILCIMNHADTGGAALAFSELVEHLSFDYGVKCVVLTGKPNRINKYCDKLNIENYSFPFKNFISHEKQPEILWRKVLSLRHYLGNQVALKSIEKTLDIASFDLVYSNLDRIDIGAILAKKYERPHVWHLREHLDTDFKTLSIYNDYIDYMLAFPSRYIAVSDSVREAWLNRGLCPGSGITTIYDGVDCNNIRRKDDWFRNGKVNFLFLGGYAESKGQKAFLDVMQQLDPSLIAQMTLTFYGQGDYGPVRDSITRDDVRAATHFNGYRSDIYNFIGDYDVGINYSSSEGFGRVTVEYMAAGLVPLVSACGANPEIVRDDQDGYVVDSGDTSAVRSLLESIITHKEALPAMASEAIERAEVFSTSHHIQQMYDLFEEVINHG